MNGKFCPFCGAGNPPVEVCLNCGTGFKSPPAEGCRGDCRPGGESSGAPLLSTGTPYLTVRERNYLALVFERDGMNYSRTDGGGYYHQHDVGAELIRKDILTTKTDGCLVQVVPKGHIRWPKKWVRA